MPTEISDYCQKLLKEAIEIQSNKKIMKAIDFVPTNSGEDITMKEWINGSEEFFNENKHIFERKFPDADELKV